MDSSTVIFSFLEELDEFLWHFGFALICLSGMYLTIKSRFFQFKVLANTSKNIKAVVEESKKKDQNGINPIKLYFTSVGGMVGLGNIVGISMAVLIGGPGSIFWMWTVVLFGTLLKYSEIYLGVKHRVPDGRSSYNGGPMYFIQDAFKSNGKVLAVVSSLFLCIYGVEVLQFKILVDRINFSTGIERDYIIYGLLALVLYSAVGGIKRIANICSIIMPFFLCFYVVACLYIIGKNISDLPPLLLLIVKSAFTGHAAVGGFAGSSFLFSAYMGASKAVYSGDIAIGYDSVVQSETRITNPQKQAKLSIFALTTDTIICTLTTLTVAITGAWYSENFREPSEVISYVLSSYFPYSDYIITALFFFAGFTTIIGYLAVGSKSADFISKKYGKKIFFAYAIFAFIFFSHFSQREVALIMSLTSVFLIFLNISAILKLSNEINFNKE